MTCYLTEESVSSLRDGIETIVIPIHDPHDLESLVFHTQRGGVYDVVEWLLGQLGRPMELERVCGLSVTPSGAQVTVNLELRQPGLQLEHWLRRTSYGFQVRPRPEGDVEVIVSDGIVTESLALSVRAMATEKFTDKHKPWWEAQIGYVPMDLEAEAAEHSGPTDQG